MIQRIRDALHERKIRKLGHAFTEAMSSGRRQEAAYLWAAQCKAINSRSSRQVERMERRMGIK